MSLVVTKAALALKNADANFKLVKFEAHKPKRKNPIGSEDTQKQVVGRESVGKDVDLKKIRHEIVRFGMQGFDPTKKEEAKIALAVSLGAKPPRREYINYKELMKKRKEEKKREIEEKELMHSKTVLTSTGKSKSKKKGKAGNDVGHFLSNYGKVNKKDLQKKDKSTKKTQKKKV